MKQRALSHLCSQGPSSGAAPGGKDGRSASTTLGLGVLQLRAPIKQRGYVPLQGANGKKADLILQLKDLRADPHVNHNRLTVHAD